MRHGTERGSGELAVPAYELFSSTEILGKMAMERMLAGLSTRRDGVGLEPVGEQVSAACTATSKSAVSRRFVAMTETALGELLAADLHNLGLVALRRRTRSRRWSRPSSRTHAPKGAPIDLSCGSLRGHGSPR